MDEETKQDLDLENQDEEGTSEDSDESEELDLSEDENADPLDRIDDVEELRKQAKKERSMRQRLAKKADTKVVAKTPKIDESKFVTKDDYYKGNEKKAAKQLTTIAPDDSEEDAEFKQDLKANWKEVVRYYRDISGRETVEDIVDDITDAYNAFRRRNPRKESDKGKEAASILNRSTGKGGKTPSGTPPRKKSILRRKNTRGADQMAQWYPENN